MLCQDRDKTEKTKDHTVVETLNHLAYGPIYNYLLDVIPGFKLLQQEHCLLGLLVPLNFVLNHQWDLRDFLNAVS